MTKVKRVNTSNDAGALAMSPNVRAMRCDARRDAIDARGRDGTGRDGTGRRGEREGAIPSDVGARGTGFVRRVRGASSRGSVKE